MQTLEIPGENPPTIFSGTTIDLPEFREIGKLIKHIMGRKTAYCTVVWELENRKYIPIVNLKTDIMRTMANNIIFKLLQALRHKKFEIDLITSNRDYPNEGNEFLDDRIRMVEQPFLSVR